MSLEEGITGVGDCHDEIGQELGAMLKRTGLEERLTGMANSCDRIGQALGALVKRTRLEENLRPMTAAFGALIFNLTKEQWKMTKRYEKAIEVEGKPYIIGFGFDELIKVEKELDRGFFQIMDSLGFRELAIVFWIMLQKRQAHLSLEETNALADHLGHTEVLALVAEAQTKFFGEVKAKRDANAAKAKEPAE